MKSEILNPGGNVWERLRACWMLLRFPRQFCNGIIEQAIEDAQAQRAEAEAMHALFCGEREDILQQVHEAVTANG